MKSKEKKSLPFESAKLYPGFRFGHEADELLEAVGDFYFANEARHDRAGLAARWLLLQALCDIEDTLPRACKGIDYMQAEGLEMHYVQFLNERIATTSKGVKRWCRRKVRK